MRIEYTEKRKAVRIRAFYGDFAGDVRQWQEAYFQLIAWKNTWSVPYSLDCCSNHCHEPYVLMTVDADCADRVIETMSDLGYHKICRDDVIIRIVCPEYEEAVDEYYFE